MQQGNHPPNNRVTILIAIIGVMGAVLAAMIGNWHNLFPSLPIDEIIKEPIYVKPPDNEILQNQKEVTNPPEDSLEKIENELQQIKVECNGSVNDKWNCPF